MDLRSGSRETLRSFLFSPWTKLHTVKRLIFGVDQRTSWIYTLNPTTRTQSKESFQLEKSKEQGTNGHRNRPAVPWRFTLLWLPSAETWAAPSSQVWIWFKRPSHNCPWAWSHMLGPFRKPTELGSSHLTGRSCEVPCQGQTGEAVSCTVRMFRERFTVHNSTPLVGAWGSSLVQMRGSQCFPGKKGAKEIWQQTDRNRSKFYSRIPQKCWGNRTVPEKAACIWRTTARVLCEWMNEGEAGGWNDSLPSKTTVLQGLTGNKYLYYLPAVKKWSGLFPEYINVSCSKSTIHTVSLAEKTLSNPARQAMRGEQLDSKERKKVCPACHPQSTRIIADIGTCESGVMARFS